MPKEKKEEKQERKQKRKENKRKNILNACSCCRIKKIKCTGGAQCACCTRNGLMCHYPPAKKRGPKNRQKNILHNDINRVQKDDTINDLIERVSNVENMLDDLNKVSGELNDKSLSSREASAQSFDKLSQSVAAIMCDPSNLLLTLPDTVNNSYVNLQYGNPTNPIDKLAEDYFLSDQYFSQDVSSSTSNIHPNYQDDLILASQQSYVLQDMLPTFLEDNASFTNAYSTEISEESTFTDAFSSDKHPL
ncbi:12837_t:CDS:2 [Dentiscutata erythropus]|uniref:12837_t:CDS:1 n=1 Tax=Dentiscutata erythropus TaxID=1348616 RepID=A0A9N9EII2_9GLOM|nr:12837_t:CDS:2 [Dentiscutata erythropus]